MRRMSNQSIGCSRVMQSRHGGRYGGRLIESVGDYLSIPSRDILNGFFFKTKNTVSSNSRYLVR